jgi:hypothetical protein
MSDQEIYLDQNEASNFLKELGLDRAPGTLAKLRCVGGGPVYRKFGRFPRYTPARLHEYAMSQLSPELTSTSQQLGSSRPRRVAPIEPPVHAPDGGDG